jgi:hypothetical protein
MLRILTAATLSIGLMAAAGAASAANSPSNSTSTSNNSANSQSSNSQSSSMSGSGNQMNHTNLRQQLKSELNGDGYTDIKITPSSFFIQAKDKKGNPVAMVVGPDSFTAVTAVPTNASASASANGSNAGNSGSNSQQSQSK